MKILHITDVLSPGGLERIVVELASAAATRGDDVSVLALEGGSLWSELSVPVRRVPGRARRGFKPVVQLIPSIVREVWSGGYDVVHAHQRGVALVALLVNAARRILAHGECVVVEHVHNVFQPTVVARVLSFRAPVLMACGSAVEQMLLHDFGRPRERVVRILNGVNDSTSWSKVAEEGSIRILGVGRLVEQKDPIRFVNIVAALHARGVPVEACWIGEGPLRDEVLEAVRRKSLESVVQLPGQQASEPWYRWSTFLLLTSRWEGLPLAGLESYSAGRGVVALDVGSCADLFEESFASGILLNPKSADAVIADAIQRARTAHAFGRWSNDGRRLYEYKFKLVDMVEKVLAVYREAVLERRRVG